MNLEDLMTKKIVVIDLSSSIKEAACKMKEFDIGFLPVIDNKKVVGVVTDRDIIVRNIANELDPKIKDAMSKTVITIDKNENVDTLLEIMRNKKIKRVIVNDNNKMVGIISLADLLNKDIDILKTIEEINTIYKNDDVYDTEIDEFYL